MSIALMSLLGRGEGILGSALGGALGSSGGIMGSLVERVLSGLGEGGSKVDFQNESQKELEKLKRLSLGLPPP